MILLPGDALLYAPSSVYGRIIAVKTWHNVSHLEIYTGNAKSVASRDGIGTGEYPVRTAGLLTVCRPKVPIDVAKGLAWFRSQPHQPYGWLDLLWFIGVPIPEGWSNGVVCSPFGAKFWQASGFDAFNAHEQPEKIAPFEFAVTPLVDVLPFTPGVMFA